MKELFLVRHAKSSWKDPGLRDFDRPLNNRGKKAIPVMVSHLKSNHVQPDLFLSSPARRTKETALGMAMELGLKDTQIRYVPELYLADIRALLNAINEVENNIQCLFVFGHNPGITEFADYLTGSYLGNMPTCSIAHIRLPFGQWNLVSERTGQLLSFDYPKKFGDY